VRNPFRRRPPEPSGAPEPPKTPLTPAQEDELRVLARDLVVPAFAERDHVTQVLADHLYGDVDPRAAAEAARRITAEAWARRDAELSASSGPSDYDRLAAAFRALEERAVVARMAFACCQTCGDTEIRDERTGGEWGFTYFHDQDAERLADPETTLLLAYGAFGDQSEDVEVGRAVRDALVAEGLVVAWDDDPRARLAVAIRDWRKPLPA
jgi:hypothetical protein